MRISNDLMLNTPEKHNQPNKEAKPTKSILTEEDEVMQFENNFGSKLKGNIDGAYHSHCTSNVDIKEDKKSDVK